MKKYLFIVLLSVNLANAQKGLVNYGYIDAKGIGNAKGPDSNSYLVFNKEQSYYVTAKDSLENQATKNETQTFNTDDDSAGHIVVGKKVSDQGDQVAYHIKKNTIWSNVLYRKQFYIKEVATKQDWKIENETKKIGNFKCKKATVNFRGRNYIAWFTTDIALPYGPWKLHGLPGLILEAYDTNKNAYWYFKGVEYPSKTNEAVKYMSLPKNFTWLSYSDFKKAQQNEILKAEEKNKMVMKDFPAMQALAPQLKDMFLECE